MAEYRIYSGLTRVCKCEDADITVGLSKKRVFLIIRIKTVKERRLNGVLYIKKGS